MSIFDRFKINKEELSELIDKCYAQITLTHHLKEKERKKKKIRKRAIVKSRIKGWK